MSKKSTKSTRILLLIFAFIVGLVVAFLRPQAIQSMLSIIGILVGISYFFMTSRESEKDKNNDKKNNQETDDRSGWFLIVQMLLYFIIGGAIGSTIPFFIQMYG